MFEKFVLPVLLLTLMLLVGCTGPAERAPLQANAVPVTAEELDEQVFLKDIKDIKVIEEAHQTTTEYRHRGQLVLVKVEPEGGPTYYIDPLHNKRIPQSSQELIDSGVQPVYWVIKEF